MSTSVRTPHTRIPSVKSSSTNNYYPSSSVENPSSSNSHQASSTLPNNSHITPGRQPSYSVSFGTNSMGLSNGGIGASPSSSTSPSARSNKAGGSTISPSSGSGGSGGTGFKLRSLLPFGPNKSPTPISPNVSPSEPSNGSFGGFGSVRRSMTLQRERKLSGSGSGVSPSETTTPNTGTRERKGSIGKNGATSAPKTISHFGFRGSVGKGKGKGKVTTSYGDDIPVISIDKQSSGDGVNELGVYSGSKSMDVRRASSDTIVSGTGRLYPNSRSRSIDWGSAGRTASTTSVPESFSSTSQMRLAEELETDQDGDYESHPYTPYAHSSSSASTIPIYSPNAFESPLDSPDPLLLHQDPVQPLSNSLPNGSSHDHPIDLSTIIEADSSGISKHLPSATSSEASTSATNSRAQSEEPQPFPSKERYPANSVLSGLNDFLQPPIQAPPRSVSLHALRSSPSGSSASLTPSSGIEADASASLGTRSPSQSPHLQTPSPTLHPPLSPFEPPESSSSPVPTSGFRSPSSLSTLPSPFEPNLDSNLARRQSSGSPDYLDDSALELSVTDVDRQVRDAIRRSIDSAKKSRNSGGWLNDIDARVIDGEEPGDGFLNGPGEESRIEENEVEEMLNAGAGFRRPGNERVISTMSINFDALDPDLRTLLSPNRFTPNSTKAPSATTSASTAKSEAGLPNSTLSSVPVYSPVAASASTISPFSSPWSQGNGSATIIAPTPTVSRTTGIASIRSRKNALGMDLNVPGSSQFGLKTPSPTPSESSVPEVVSPISPTSTSSSSTPGSILPKPPPLPLPPQQIDTGTTGIVAAAKSALLGRRQAGQSSLPRLKPVVKQGQEPIQSNLTSTTVASLPGNANGTFKTTGAEAETLSSAEASFRTAPTSTTITTTIPSATISSISVSSIPCAPSAVCPPSSTTSSPRRQEQTPAQSSSVPVEIIPASPSSIYRTVSNSPSGSTSNIPTAMRDFSSTAPSSPLGGAFVLATSIPKVERADQRTFVDFGDGEVGRNEFSRYEPNRAATLGRAGGAGTRARMALSTRSSSPSPSASPSTVSSHSHKLASGLESRRPTSGTASTASGRRIASGDYPRAIDPTRLSPGRAHFHSPQSQGQALPEMLNDAASITSKSFWKGRHRRRSMSVGTDPRAAMIASASVSHSSSANATRGFLAASRRTRENSSVLSHNDSGSGRPGTSLSGSSYGGTSQRERGPSDGPMQLKKPPTMEWIGPRTAKAFKAAGLLDFDAPIGSTRPSEFSDVGREGTGMSSSKFGSLRSPSRITYSEFGSTARGKSSHRRPSVGTSGTGYFGLGGSPSPTSVIGSPTFAYRERDRETPTRSASTAPTSVSGASWLRDRDGERVERVDRERERDRVDRERERDRDYEEMVALKDRHATETGALLGALADSQRSARVLREEIAELRERLLDLERDNERMEGVCEELKMQNEEIKDGYQTSREEFEYRLEEEIDRANRAEQENTRLREECARLVGLEAEVERLRRNIGSTKGRHNQPYANSPLRHSSRPGSPSFEFDSGEVEGFGAHEVEMSAESDGNAEGASPVATKEFSTHTKSIHSPFLPPLSSPFPVATRIPHHHSSSALSDEDLDISRSRRISASSIFPVPPANMSLLMLEDSIHDMDAVDRQLLDNRSYQSSNFSGYSGQESPPSSPTIAIPLRQQEGSSSAHKSEKTHRPNASIASSQSPTTPSFSMMSGSPESLFLRPEHEMHLRDLDSKSFHFKLDDDEEEGIEEVPR
ncbi:hypothetical protein K435DRAFT_845039 [Dendrothele bispora CBS 962.96]|uniref:Uncharacterized protein n=1 Tax=Dendrothele bispora (strain CBS 962.96) TaxID=1314807 RepID=A0A4S8KYF0_DENBC|nr:hypothetical protein K435DRAFT_845039 [Dendrothele bispora CBS 962.96]